VHIRTRWLMVLFGLGVVPVVWLVLVWNTTPPPWPVLTADFIAVVGLLVGPWLVLVGRRFVRELRGDREAGRVYSRILIVTAIIAIGGPLAGATVGGLFIEDVPGATAGVAVFSILAATLVALVGAVLFPWMYLLTRSVTRERAARVRAEERAELAAHLHDSVLQALTLMQKQADNPAVLRLARRTERELRAWLYGGRSEVADDIAGAVRAAVEEVEDRFAVTVELVTVGTGPLDARSRAVIGAIREALTNAAKHAGVRRISAFVEVTDSEVYAVVRDRGRGFDPATAAGVGRRGIADSIEGRLRQYGGTATIRSAVGDGTEVEVRLP